jgi:hypothetical protein
MLVAMLVVMILVAAPAFADTAFTQIGGVASFSDSEFFGPDTAAAQVGGVTAVGQSEFFNGGIFGDGIF